MTRKQATIAVRSGLNDDEQYGCVVPPIHLSSTYNFTGFNEPRAHDYSRRGNPTRDVVQRALAELEGGAGAVLTNTGMSAIHRFLYLLQQVQVNKRTFLERTWHGLSSKIICYGDVR